MYQLSDYDYVLPEELIAQKAVEPAHDARMLVVDRQTGNWQDQHFFDLPKMIDQNAVIFFNKSKVIKARIPLHHVVVIDREKKEGILEQGEIFVYRIIDSAHIEVLVSDGKHFRP